VENIYIVTTFTSTIFLDCNLKFFLEPELEAQKGDKHWSRAVFLKGCSANFLGSYSYYYFCGKLWDFASFKVFSKKTLDISVPPNLIWCLACRELKESLNTTAIEIYGALTALYFIIYLCVWASLADGNQFSWKKNTFCWNYYLSLFDINCCQGRILFFYCNVRIIKFTWIFDNDLWIIATQ